MPLEWDAAKNVANIAMRSIDFEGVTRLDWATSLTIEDTRSDYGEPRFITIGSIDGVLHVVVPTPRGEAQRIISVRKANPRERKLYAAQTKSLPDR